MQGDRLYSTLYNDMYAFNLENRRWFPLGLHPPKKGKGEAAAMEEPAASSGTGDPTQQQQQQRQDSGGGGSIRLPQRVRPEMHAMLQKMLADRGGLVHGAAAKIQANFRGYRVRQVHAIDGVGLLVGFTWCEAMRDFEHLLGLFRFRIVLPSSFTARPPWTPVHCRHTRLTAWVARSASCYTALPPTALTLMHKI